ncbi:uncharacterized protein STEHIDRAFT_162111 [Stereum hirsutum FP-91666 SS1]|uniref:uncharacterized protein n=1 Tax=Stereum hirsutum (strain FP-91666) TaxID=721885 RepID=UPI000444A711|nr:uncharacterized protein STEHIDRAFT_162111 [Stereum hirsutum FP-91666 SS1]EIM81115.1 hypothetical protein STEHIDRAFT_162111 [Stereum hirsutum FP-91666 SS1]
MSWPSDYITRPLPAGLHLSTALHLPPQQHRQAPQRVYLNNNSGSTLTIMANATQSVAPFRIEPWTDSLFVPLPTFIHRTLRSISQATMPDRKCFNEELINTLVSLPFELAAISAFGPQWYVDMVEHARSPEDNVPGVLPDVVKRWADIQQVISGSDSRYLAVVPRGWASSMEASYLQKLRLRLIQEVDSETNKRPSIDQGSGFDPFFRIPVFYQIFDILAYTHRNHETSFEMLRAAAEAGFANIAWMMTEIFVDLCPTCQRTAANNGDLVTDHPSYFVLHGGHNLNADSGS